MSKLTLKALVCLIAALAIGPVGTADLAGAASARSASVPIAAAKLAAAKDANSSPAAQAFKKRLAAELGNRSTGFTLPYEGNLLADGVRIDALLQNIFDADSYLNYVYKKYEYAITASDRGSSVKFTVTYLENKQQSDYVRKHADSTLKTLIKSGMSNHQKVKAIHDWIVLNFAYDQSLNLRTAYDGLSKGKTVCQGYALMAQAMLTQAGIPSKIVSGTVKTGEHAWNLVQLDSKWYNLDVTFDDPTPDRKGEISYGYYLLSDREISKDHKWTTSRPAANTSYPATLQALIKQDKKLSGAYRSMYEAFEYQYLESANIVADAAALKQRIKAALAAGSKELKFRYLKAGTLSATLKSMNKEMGGYSVVYQEFSRGSSSQDVLVHLKFGSSR